VIALVVLWQVLTRALEIPNFLLPAPTDVARLIVDEWPLIQMHSLATIGSIISGYVAAVLFALAISALMIRFPLVERLIMPIFVGLQSVPKIAIAPLILVWVGAGIGSKILVVTSIAFFPIVINTDGGLQGGRPRARRRVPLGPMRTSGRCSSACGCPYAMPYIFAGLRIATTARGARRDRGRMARRLERAWLPGSLRQLQLQHRALVRGDHRAGGDRHRPSSAFMSWVER
jgi:NitT/TauT family transport system permease protein